MYENYARIRDEHGLTDYAVSRSSGVATATLTAWKQGKYTPKIGKLLRIADALGVSVTELLGDKK